MHILEAIKEIAVTFAALTGAIVAILGLRSWKAQMEGKASHDLARAILRATYKMRDGLSSIRQLELIGSATVQAAIHAGFLDEADRKDGVKATQAVYAMKWEYIAKADNELNVAWREAEVLWAHEMDEPIEKLRSHMYTLRLATRRYIRHGAGSPPLSAKALEENDRVLHASEEPDDFGGQIDQAIKDIETVVRKRLK